MKQRVGELGTCSRRIEALNEIYILRLFMCFDQKSPSSIDRLETISYNRRVKPIDYSGDSF